MSSPFTLRYVHVARPRLSRDAGSFQHQEAPFGLLPTYSRRSTAIETQLNGMADDSAQNEPTAQAPAPATNGQDVPVDGDGVASQTLGTPQKDTVMADAPVDNNIAVCLMMEGRQFLDVLTGVVFSGSRCPSSQSRSCPYGDTCARL